jgi:hypothetical protein
MPGGYVVRDANGQSIAFVYGRATEAEAMQAKVLTMDEARRIATNIARAARAAREGRARGVSNGNENPSRRCIGWGQAVVNE